MTKSELIKALNPYPDDLEVRFIKYPSHKSLAFWDSHEWYVCEKKYTNGPPDERFLAILVEDESV